MSSSGANRFYFLVTVTKQLSAQRQIERIANPFSNRHLPSLGAALNVSVLRIRKDDLYSFSHI